MVTNEIRRLIKSLVEASKESGVNEEEIIGLFKETFSLENLTDLVTDGLSIFRKKVEKKLQEDEFDFELNSRLYWQAVELLCICYEKKGSTYSAKLLSIELAKKTNIKQSTALQVIQKIVTKLKKGLVEKDLYKLRKYEKIENIFTNQTLTLSISYIEGI